MRKNDLFILVMFLFLIPIVSAIPNNKLMLYGKTRIEAEGEGDIVKGYFPLTFYYHYLSIDGYVLGVDNNGVIYWVVQPDTTYFWKTDVKAYGYDLNGMVYIEGVLSFNGLNEDYEVVTSTFKYISPLDFEKIPERKTGIAWGTINIHKDRYQFHGRGLLADTSYTLIELSSSWDPPINNVLGTGISNLSGDLKIKGHYIPTSGKPIWLVLSSDIDIMNSKFINWNTEEYLLPIDYFN